MNGFSVLTDRMVGKYVLRIIMSDGDVLIRETDIGQRSFSRRAWLSAPKAGGDTPSGFVWRNWEEVIAIDDSTEYEIACGCGCRRKAA